nr:reverse transcriptase domain-containing protein [Tanacetum cinerariifolium]
HHNVYTPSSSIPQVEYASSVNQQPGFSQPDSGLIVPVFQKGEGHMSKQCTKPKRKRDESCFKDKVLLVQAQTTQTVITHNAAYQADDLDAYESDCDEINTAKVALMANLSHYGSDNLAENSMNSLKPTPSSRPTQVEVPKELPKVSMVNTSLRKLKHHLASFDVLSKKEPQPQLSLRKLKKRIKSLSGNMKEDKIKQELEEIKTINIKLDLKVTKLIAENEHLKQTYKQLYDSIKSSRIRLKEQCDDLIKQVNLKSAENSNLNASIQEQVLVITALKDNLRKLKGKVIVDEIVISHPIDLEMLKVDVDISHETSVARSPRQNGVIERRNRTLLEAARIIENLGKLQPKADIVAPELATSTGSPSLTIVDQDAPSPSNSQSTPETQPPVISNNVEEDNHDIEVAHMGNDPFFGMPIPKVTVIVKRTKSKQNQTKPSTKWKAKKSQKSTKVNKKSTHPKSKSKTEPSIKVKGVTDDALHLYLFPHSLTHHATAWFDRLPRNSINTFEQMAKMFLGKYFQPSMVKKLRNEITNFRQRPDESLFKAWECYKLSIDRCPNHNMLPVTQIDTFYNGLTLRRRDTINAVAGGTFMKRRPEECYDLIENMTAHHNDYTSAQQSESSGFFTSSFDPKIIALKAEMAKINKNLMKVLQINQQVKAVTLNCETCGGPHSYNDCPATIGQPKNVYAARAYQGGNYYQPQAYQARAYQAPGYQALVHQTPIPQPALKPHQKPPIPYPSRFHDQKLRNKANDQKEKFFQIFKDLDFNISFADALILMPKFGPAIKSLLTNKDKLSILKTRRALIDVYAAKLTLQVNNEAVTFNLDQTSRYSANNNDMTANRIDVIDMACEEYSDFLLEEVDAFLTLENDLTSPEVDHSYYDTEGDTLLLEAFLNDDLLLSPPNQGMYLPQVRKELKICKDKNDKSSIDEPPEVELRDLPPHLEYAFMEGNDKLLVIISKDLSVEEKAAFIKVLKSHKQAITWKLSDIKGIDPEFYTHKILMEDDFKPAVPHQRRANPKIHDVIKKEDCTDSNVASIAHELKGQIPVGGNQDRSFN